MSKTVFGADSVLVFEREEDKVKIMQVSTKTGSIEIEFTPVQWARLGVTAGWWKEYDCNGGRAVQVAQSEANRARAQEEAAQAATKREQAQQEADQLVEESSAASDEAVIDPREDVR